MDNKEEEVPEWFQSFFDKTNSRYREILEKIETLLGEIQNVEDRLDNLTNVRQLRKKLANARNQIAKNTADIAILNERLKNTQDDLAVCEVKDRDNKSRLEALQERLFLLGDFCEVKFSGVPVGLDNREAASKILEAIGLVDMSTHILFVRDWLDEKAQSETSSDAINKSKANGMRTFVVKFSHAVVRDNVVAHSYKLRNKTCEKIFGCGGEGKISINAIWPKKVYELYRLALSISKQLNYAKPVIRNLTVFMRETRKSPLIMIDFPEDLVALQPRQL